MVHEHYPPYHRHDHCPWGGDHNKRYCGTCGVEYCTKCGKEWGYRRYVWPRQEWDYPIYLCKH